MTPQANAIRLLKVIRYSLQVYHKPTYIRLFDVLCTRKPVIHFVVRLYRFFKPGFLSTWMLAAYGAKAFLSVRCSADFKGTIATTAIWANEKKTLNYVKHAIEGRSVKDISYNFRNIFRLETLGWVLYILKHWAKFCQYVRIVGYINRRNDFMPACRSIEALSYALRFRLAFRLSSPQAVLTTSYYGPDAVALIDVAHLRQIPIVYIAHAYSPPSIIPMRMHVDCVIVPSSKALQHCCPQGVPHDTKVFYTGVDAVFSPLRLPNERLIGLRVGVFLSSPVNTRDFKNIIYEIQMVLKPSTLLIRMHPVALTSVNLASYVADYSNVVITFGTPLDADVAQCDLALVGASGVALQLLRMGLPCVYYAKFEDCPYDYCGFVSDKIIPEVKNFNEIKCELLQSFYDKTEWTESFEEFDPYYGQSVDVNAIIREAFQPFSSS